MTFDLLPLGPSRSETFWGTSQIEEADRTGISITLACRTLIQEHRPFKSGVAVWEADGDFLTLIHVCSVLSIAIAHRKPRPIDAFDTFT